MLCLYLLETNTGNEKRLNSVLSDATYKLQNPPAMVGFNLLDNLDLPSYQTFYDTTKHPFWEKAKILWEALNRGFNRYPSGEISLVFKYK